MPRVEGEPTLYDRLQTLPKASLISLELRYLKDDSVPGGAHFIDTDLYKKILEINLSIRWRAPRSRAERINFMKVMPDQARVLEYICGVDRFLRYNNIADIRLRAYNVLRRTVQNKSAAHKRILIEPVKIPA